jgi:hypothetical protein
MKRLKVAVESATFFERHPRLFAALAVLFPVCFETKGENSSAEPDARIVLADTRDAFDMATMREAPAYVILSRVGRSRRYTNEAVQFSNVGALAACLRNLALPDPESGNFCPIDMEAGDEVLATKAGHPCWVRRPATGGKGSVDFVSVAPVQLAENEHVADAFNRERYLGLLPLIHFLRLITGNNGWQSPIRRACIVIDDPCLSRESYGCLSFSSLAAHAHLRNYHAAIATVPLDSGRVSPSNKALFREAPDRLSLLIHGNDHVSLEMARHYEHQERLAILAQAIQRVSHLEDRQSLPVSRVMEPPYGIISRGMMEPLLTLGYEAVLITSQRFMGCNRDFEFPPQFGLESAECLSGGLCMLPRIRMAPGWKTEVILAELLGQPIIVAGHHYDAAQGMALFEEIADTVNGLGTTRWSNVTEIARGHYRTRKEGGDFCVRLGSRRISLDVPEGIERITIERPWITDGAQETLIIKTAGTTSSPRQVSAGASESIATGGARKLEILSPKSDALDPASVPSRRIRIWPKVRRFLMEARDRAYPYLHPSSRKPRHAKSGPGIPKHGEFPAAPV